MNTSLSSLYRVVVTNCLISSQLPVNAIPVTANYCRLTKIQQKTTTLQHLNEFLINFVYVATRNNMMFLAQCSKFS